MRIYKNLTITNIGLNIGLYLRTPTKKEQRESAYVSRKRMWRTPPEPLSADTLSSVKLVLKRALGS